MRFYAAPCRLTKIALSIGESAIERVATPHGFEP
jgi:hypothetical protein